MFIFAVVVSPARVIVCLIKPAYRQLSCDLAEIVSASVLVSACSPFTFLLFVPPLVLFNFSWNFFGPAHVQHLRAAARGAAGSLSAHLERRQRARFVCVWVRFLCACACVFVCLVCVSVFTRLTSLSFLLIFILPKNACARTSSRNRPSYGVRTLGRSSCCCPKQEANGGTSKASHRRAWDTLRRRKDYILATEVCILPSYNQTNKQWKDLLISCPFIERFKWNLVSTELQSDIFKTCPSLRYSQAAFNKAEIIFLSVYQI